MRREKAARIGRKKKTNQMIFAGIIAAVAIGIGFGVYSYIQNPPRTASFGAVGSTHEHAAFVLALHNVAVNFAQPQYQLKSQYVHFEGGNGDTMHKHATGVDVGFFFETVNMKFSKDCLVLANSTEYCNDGTNTLKFYVNGLSNSMYDKYVMRDNDKILISYGSETEEQLQEQLAALDAVLIQKQ